MQSIKEKDRERKKIKNSIKLYLDEFILITADLDFQVLENHIN